MQPFSDLSAFLLSIYPIEENVLKDYLSYWQPFSASKKSIITESGKTERYLYFVVNGVQKSYYRNDNKEHVMFFAYNPSFSGIVESFLTQTPSKYNLECITDCEFLRIPFSKHEAQLSKHRPLETLFRKATEQFLLGMIERHHQLLAFNTETRFRLFLERSKHLLNMVPQKDMASYLRIDATNFSKLINTHVI
ncbi:Crp/Fnr family transcriptional regulator [Seonamhaeicola marinus]|uniref:Crp/Fnr family transcriptional regulator n=1 Tax=Seonamhaeicola marinus TaxID=1912246 RepID=A0A5D0HJR5_9FLAO|nr:cyclic nucleotide-binding domain-containing protein [Seonamhaeicola marinus]TYA71624.1 Crp/Fnr family transcriptional regulator [Seonamhaeicola marinus]